MNLQDIKDFLDEKVILYNNPAFIESDPISIPHQYTLKEDIEISGFLSATIAWGNRKAIIKNAQKMMSLLDDSPYDFVMNHSAGELQKLDSFVHRTFNGFDLQTFIQNLKRIYTEYGGLENIFSSHQSADSLQPAISRFKKIFFREDLMIRTQKHVSDPERNSSAKRINMFLRWMVRSDRSGVDFGIWKSIPMSILSCPLDVHSGRVARQTGLLLRKQNDARAVQELDLSLRQLDPHDPVRYDFALFGLGVSEKNSW